MTPEQSTSKLPIWPFFLSSALLLGLTAAILSRSSGPANPWELGTGVVCVVASAVILITPFLRRNKDANALAQADLLAQNLAQIGKIEQVASQIANATAQWQGVQGSATQVAETSKELAASMAREAKGFAEFMQKASDNEKAHLRLEVEKLRRSEMEWVQVITHMLDHTFALMAGAQQTGQRNLIDQIGQFQAACVDVARRVGIAPILSAPNETFDPKIHQIVEEMVTPEPNATIKGTLASGYSYQGRIVRRALVALEGGTPAAAEAKPSES